MITLFAFVFLLLLLEICLFLKEVLLVLVCGTMQKGDRGKEDTAYSIQVFRPLPELARRGPGAVYSLASLTLP